MTRIRSTREPTDNTVVQAQQNPQDQVIQRHAVWNETTGSWEEANHETVQGFGRSFGDDRTNLVDDTAGGKSVNVEFHDDGRIDSDSLPKGITVTNIGTPNSPEFLVSHDGINEDGTVSAGWSARTSQVDDIGLVIQHRGRIPEEHDPATSDNNDSQRGVTNFRQT